MRATLYYFHDPMCSWCWGYRPTFDRLREKLPSNISVKYVLGGLAPDTEEPMSAELRTTIKSHWRKIHDALGSEFNFDFWQKCQPRRDTYKACRAVIVARNQGLELQMIEAIQQAYYLRAMNPSDIDTLVKIATETGLDADGFRVALFSEKTNRQLQQDIIMTRQWRVQGFPSLVLLVNEQRVPIPVDYKDEENSLKLIRA